MAKATLDSTTYDLKALMQTAEESLCTNLNIGIIILKIDQNDYGNHFYLTSNAAANNVLQTDFSLYHNRTMRDAAPSLLDTNLPKLYAQAARTQTAIDCGLIPYGDENIPKAFFTARAIPLTQDIVGIYFERKHPDKNYFSNFLERGQSKLIDELQIGVIIIEVDENDYGNHRYIANNHAASIVTGADFRHYIGKTYREAAPAMLDTRLPELYVQAAKTQKTIDCGELIYGDKYMPEGVFAMRAIPLGGKTVALSVENVTQRKQTARTLKTQTNIFNTILEAQSVMVSLIDPKGNYLNAYGSWHRQLGLKGRRMTGKNTYELFPEYKKTVLQAQLGKSTSFTITNNSTKQLYAFQNILMPYHEGGVLHIAFDISDLKQTEQELRLSQDRFKAALKNTNIVVYNQDTDLRYTWTFNTHPKLPSEYLYQKNDLDIFPEAEAKIFNSIKQKVLDTGIGIQTEAETTIDRKKTFQNLTVEPLFDEHGNINGVTCAAVDITKQKEREAQQRNYIAEQARFRHQLDLAHITRVATMGELATGLAHELNQPLATIGGYTHGCIRRLSADAIEKNALLETLHQIETQTHRAGSIIRRLLEFVRKAPTKKSPHYVNPLVQDALDFMSMDIKKHHVQLSTEFCTENPVIRVDHIQIEQVLVNLVKNAIEALSNTSKNKRKIKLITECDSKTPHVLIHIIDNGPGFSPEVEAKLFQQYYTTKSTGIGMGLAISRTLIESHGGFIKLNSNTSAHKGVRATIKLPISQEEPSHDEGQNR